ncbi:Para-aminobenzoate synthase, aminase component [hydrothermal vent metagenome]|uniref:aminodeoxychorismate synthase n=1 Tax=hydrothermal vent metagenome TaxID=652676 RepID=A0A3B1CB21_9ZZZZ
MGNTQRTVKSEKKDNRTPNRSVSIRKTGWTAPVSVFSQVKLRDGLIWLDSGMDRAGMGRWSYLMWEPFATIQSAGDGYTLVENGESKPVTGDPFKAVGRFMARRRSDDKKEWPPFTGGAAGFFGYDLLSHCEPSTKLVKTGRAEEGDIWLGFYDRVIAFDNEAKKTYLIVNIETGLDPEPGLNELESIVRKSIGREPSRFKETDGSFKIELASNFSQEGYFSAIEKIRRYIEQGDCYQVNIAQRFSAKGAFDPIELYLRLRSINPAPFSAYLNTGSAQILSSSPERFIRLRDGHAQTRPIKGTRPRGSNEQEDARLIEELIKSGKDRAENVMIVDLLRNDLSKACIPNSVKVSQLCAIEKFPTVSHLVSSVEGEVKPEYGAIDLLGMAFPGGSVTGAPKIRAMEIIDELEPDPRGVYCGAIGYIGFNGSMDTSIVIRTIIHCAGLIKFHSGGGITYLSRAEEEYDETMDKARALIEAVTG